MKNNYVMGRWWWIGGFVVVIGTGLSWVSTAEEKALSKPTAAPSKTTPSSATDTTAGKPGELSTPSAVTKRFIGLLGRSDGEQLKRLIHSVGPEEARFNEAAVKFFAASSKLRDVSLARFGPGGEVSPINGNDPTSVAQLQLEEEVTGQEAVVRLPAGHNPMVYYLDHVAGGWKVRLYKTFGEVIDSCRLPGTVIEKGEAAYKAVNELAQDIKSGKFSTAQDAQKKLESALGVD
jgi:hypothetical protein